MADPVAAKDQPSRWHRWRGTIGFLILTAGLSLSLWRSEVANNARFDDQCRQAADTRRVVHSVLDLSTQSTLPLSASATPEQRALREANAARVDRFMSQADELLREPDCS